MKNERRNMETKEDLEEVAKDYDYYHSGSGIINAFVSGANWQAQQEKRVDVDVDDKEILSILECISKFSIEKSDTFGTAQYFRIIQNDVKKYLSLQLQEDKEESLKNLPSYGKPISIDDFRKVIQKDKEEPRLPVIAMTPKGLVDTNANSYKQRPSPPPNTVEVSEWISVEDRLPEDHTIVLGYFPFGDESGLCVNTAIKRVDEVVSDFPNSTANHFVATHWMPLPSPPTN